MASKKLSVRLPLPKKGGSLSALLAPLYATATGSSARAPALGGVSGVGAIGGVDRPKSTGSGVEGIDFGKAPASATRPVPAAPGLLSSLLGNVLSGGLANILGGQSLFSGLLGDLLGSHKSPPPALTAFALPDSQEETLYVSSKGGLSSFSGTDVEGVSAGSPVVGPTYASTPAVPTQAAQQNQIIQTVKNSMLNSGALNDVITDLG